MRPVGKSTGSVSETFAYDIRGWQTGHAADRGSDRIYSETLRYMTPISGSMARWTGLISESVTQHYGSTPARSDSYGYDAIGRLTSSNNENNISYDANGNVMSLRRISATGEEIIADLTMSYNDNNRGNRLESVTNSGTEDGGTFTYAYDSAGNLTSDGRNLLEIQNNVLNLPMRVNQSGTMGGTGTSTMTYTYLGDGTRAAARAGADAGAGVDATSYAGKRYRGSFVYDVTAGGVQSLESVAVSTGRLIALTGTNGAVSFESDGFITDHLGNVAVVVNLSDSLATNIQNVILEQNEYTPFGTKLSVSGLKTQAANRWRYAGKEEQDIAGMNLRLLDFGARYYDSFTCRWNAVDPMAHKYFPMSPYNYCGNDPVNRFDPDGEDIYIISSDGTITFLLSTEDHYDVLFSTDCADGQPYYINVYDQTILPAMKNGDKPSGDSSRSDMVNIFKFAADTYDNQEWGLYYNGNSYELKTDGKGSCVGTTLDGVTWKVHSHPNEQANDRAEIESMGYVTYYDSAYDKNGRLLDRNALWHESSFYNNDASQYIRSGIPSYVYFPVSGNTYKITKIQLPYKTTIK